MARKHSQGSLLPFFLFVLILGVVGGYLFFFTNFFSTGEEEKKPTEKKIKEEKLLNTVDDWNTDVVWGDQKTGTQTMYYGVASGVMRTGQFVSKDGTVEHFENKSQIVSSGYKEDLNLSETRDNVTLWGYRKSVGDFEQVIVLSSENEDMHMNSSGEYIANCPCTLNISVFVSEPFKPNWKDTEEDMSPTPQS